METDYTELLFFCNLFFSAIEGVGVHGTLDLGNGVEVKGEINKGVGSNDGVSGMNNKNLIILSFSIDL